MIQAMGQQNTDRKLMARAELKPGSERQKTGLPHRLGLLDCKEQGGRKGGAAATTFTSLAPVGLRVGG
jgi:hypothetical protein